MPACLSWKRISSFYLEISSGNLQPWATHCYLFNLLCVRIFLSCVHTAFGTLFSPSTFSFQIGLLRLAFYLVALPRPLLQIWSSWSQSHLWRAFKRNIFRKKWVLSCTNIWKLFTVPTWCAQSLGILNGFFFLIDLLYYQVHHQASIFLAGLSRTLS